MAKANGYTPPVPSKLYKKRNIGFHISNYLDSLKRYFVIENTLAIYLEDEQINYIPDRESGYTLDLTKSSCNNGVTISFDYNKWSVKTNYSNYTNTDNTRVKCSLYFTDKYIEPLLNGTDPVLEDPLIPVTIDDNGVVKKADLSKKWYDYETKKWANAVILEDETKSYASNEVIPEENIEFYFVWIPKYRYQLWNLGLYDSLTTVDTSKVHEIPIIFGDYNTSDSVCGVWEYVMAVMEDKNGNPMSGANSNANSGFNGSFGIEDSQLTNGYDWPVQQYYDIYIYDDILYNAHYYNRILGDATGEMGPFTTKIYSESASEVNRQRYLGSWYDDYSSYVPETRVPWIARGSRSVTGLDSGAFAFIGDTGNNYPYTSFRIILTPTK